MLVPSLVHETRFLMVKKIVLVKSDFPLFLISFKRKNKKKKKKKIPKKKCDSIVLEKNIFEKPESKSRDQVNYWEGTSKR